MAKKRNVKNKKKEELKKVVEEEEQSFNIHNKLFTVLYILLFFLAFSLLIVSSYWVVSALLAAQSTLGFYLRNTAQIPPRLHGNTRHLYGSTAFCRYRVPKASSPAAS